MATNQASLVGIPEDLLFEVVRCLDFNDYFSLKYVCRSLYRDLSYNQTCSEFLRVSLKVLCH